MWVDDLLQNGNERSGVASPTVEGVFALLPTGTEDACQYPIRAGAAGRTIAPEVLPNAISGSTSVRSPVRVTAPCASATATSSNVERRGHRHGFYSHS